VYISKKHLVLVHCSTRVPKLYILAKETYILAKKPYILAKELFIHTRISMMLHKDATPKERARLQTGGRF